MNRSHRVTVVVVAYRGAQWIPECLKTLVGASRERFEVCLVDNGDNGDAIPKSLPNVDYVVLRTPTTLGFAEANNFALQQIGMNSPYVCFLNQDTRSRDGWLDACTSCLEQAPEVGAVSPLLKTYDESSWDPGFQECSRMSPTFTHDVSTTGALAPMYVVPRITAAAMFVRSIVLQQVGPFDPIFGSYYEDYDLCHRIRQAGHQIAISALATVCHFSGSSTTSEPARRKRMRQVIRNRTILRFREAGDHRWREFIRYVACTMPYNVGRSIFRTPSSQPLPVQLRAQWELLSEWRRLVSEQHDRRIWTEYLQNIGWPAAPGSDRHTSSL